MKNATNRILVIAVALLLLTNIALVIFMVAGKNKFRGRNHGMGDPFEMMVKELNMTEQQQTEYKKFKEEHMKKIKPLFDSVRAAKTAFFGLLKDSTINDSIVSVNSLRIAERQVAIDQATFAHFKNVRKLFTAEQQPKFDSFVQKMMQRGRRDSANKKEK